MTATLKTTIIQEPSSATANMTLGTTGGVTFGAAATTNTITSAAATNLTIQSAGTTAMTIDTSQNVGIGTSSPGYKLHVSTSSDGTIAVFRRVGATQNPGLALVANETGGTVGLDTLYSTSTPSITFSQGGTERMRIDYSGTLLIGLTASSTTTSQEISYTTAKNGTRYINPSSSFSAAIDFVANSAQVGRITTSGSATTYSTSSDYRLKNFVTPITTGLATVSALKPVTYRWNADDSDGEGFIAHELQEVVPLAVIGEKDAVNEDGSIKPQGVDYSKIVVHLVAAVQEQQATITALTTRIAALEAK